MNIWLLCPLLLACTGCERAASIDVIGSFLPAWMFCIAAAVVATALLRSQLVRRSLEQKIPAPVIFYPSLVVALACIFWLVLFA